ncbi:Copper transporter 3 [Raphanus sativus]|uniref:Copper transport protein n=1 Tax=Raphanus sativus TaxID=3726 RepID=A0A6J0MRU6_RAPSA|nr:copper transporter 3 [Raphanus sativus]KAJ4907911.1 Copper transporter 3 [Raphanus sativus]
MNGMSGSSSSAPAPSPSAFFQHHRRHRGGMMHMTFFWGKNTEVLFDGWPGTNLTMYWACLATIFVFSALSEWISRCGVMKAGPASFGSGIVQTVVYTVRAGLSYLIMLAVMSFNGGVFLAAMAGFGLGFMIFGSRAFRETGSNHNHTEVQSHC